MENKSKPVTSYLVNRASEPTTWAGLLAALSGAFTAFTVGDTQGAVVGAIAVIGGLISIFRKERK